MIFLEKPVHLVDVHPANDLLPPTKNPNRMSDDRFALLVEGIRALGFLQPILVRPLPVRVDGASYVIVDGVHRAKAATLLQLEKIPAVVLDADCSDEEAATMQVSLNRLRGELDLSDVARALTDLHAKGWSVAELTLTGFDKSEIEDLLKAAKTNTDDLLMGSGIGTPPTMEDASDKLPVEKPFVLELTFATRAELALAKKRLRKAAGGGRSADLAQGLIRLLEGA